jgi:hypothetical protein
LRRGVGVGVDKRDRNEKETMSRAGRTRRREGGGGRDEWRHPSARSRRLSEAEASRACAYIRPCATCIRYSHSFLRSQRTENDTGKRKTEIGISCQALDGGGEEVVPNRRCRLRNPMGVVMVSWRVSGQQVPTRAQGRMVATRVASLPTNPPHEFLSRAAPHVAAMPTSPRL